MEKEAEENPHEVFLKLLNGQQLCADNANFNDFIVFGIYG